MSKSPRPGARLSAIISEFNKVEAEFNTIVFHHGKAREEAADKLIAMLKKHGPDPDELKMVLDRFSGEAELYQTKSDQYAHFSLLCAELCSQIEKMAVDCLIEKKAERVISETFEMQIITAPPEFRIDAEKIPDAYRVNCPVIDKRLLMKDIEEGKEIPGIIREDRHGLSFLVRKKERAQ